MRDYGTATWEGGKNGCDHIVDRFATPVSEKQASNSASGNKQAIDICPKCGAKRIDNQLGLEKTPEEYVENTVKWAREVWRVLRPDGTFFLNLGDSYNGRGSNERTKESWEKYKENYDNKGLSVPSSWGERGSTRSVSVSNLKPKDLCGMPWKVAFALQADGWWLRSAMPWVKRSAMPESSTDRPASALEYMFLLTKSSKCYFDMDAIRQKQVDDLNTRKANLYPKILNATKEDLKNNAAQLGRMKNHKGHMPIPGGRNFRNTDLFYQSLEAPHGAIFCGDEMVGLDVNPQAYKEAHFATFPEKLVEPCIKAGSSEKGACPECGAPWERVIEKKTDYQGEGKNIEYRLNDPPNYKEIASYLKEKRKFLGFSKKEMDEKLETTTLYSFFEGRKGDNFSIPIPEIWRNLKNILKLDNRFDGWMLRTGKRFVPTTHRKDNPIKNVKSHDFYKQSYSIESKTIGWEPTCSHKAEPVPCIILDPFGGSGTTKNVADRLGRRGVICELKMEYIQMAKKRCHQEASLF